MSSSHHHPGEGQQMHGIITTQQSSNGVQVIDESPIDRAIKSYKYEAELHRPAAEKYQEALRMIDWLKNGPGSPRPRRTHAGRGGDPAGRAEAIYAAIQKHDWAGDTITTGDLAGEFPDMSLSAFQRSLKSLEDAGRIARSPLHSNQPRTVTTVRQ